MFTSSVSCLLIFVNHCFSAPSRPVKVCLCPFLPAEPLDVSTCLYIVQHPAEVRVFSPRVLDGMWYSSVSHIHNSTCLFVHSFIHYWVCFVLTIVQTVPILYLYITLKTVSSCSTPQESRVLRTVPLLAACLPKGKCKVLIGRRFNEERYISSFYPTVICWCYNV